VSASQLEDRVFDPQPLSELPYSFLGKSVHLNLPGKKHNTGFGLPPIAVPKIYKKKKNYLRINWKREYIMPQSNKSHHYIFSVLAVAFFRMLFCFLTARESSINSRFRLPGCLDYFKMRANLTS